MFERIFGNCEVFDIKARVLLYLANAIAPIVPHLVLKFCPHHQLSHGIGQCVSSLYISKDLSIHLYVNLYVVSVLKSLTS